MTTNGNPPLIIPQEAAAFAPITNMRALKPCLFPGCANLLAVSGYCPTHAHHKAKRRRATDAKRMTNPDTAQAFTFRSSATWKRLRRVKLAMNPICEDPFGDHQRRNTTGNAGQVHHIVSIQDDPTKAADIDNLMSVCTKCHARLSQEERSGA